MDNLVTSARQVWPAIKAQLQAGDGNELRYDPRGKAPKFCSAWSSAALAVNSVAPFLRTSRSHLETERIPGIGGPGTLEFEAQRQAGLGPERRSPNLDFIIEGDAVIFLESKTTEYLTTSHSPLKPEYGAVARRVLCTTAAREVESIIENSRRYRMLDAPQLAKHLLAAKHWWNENSSRPVALLYAFWEPENAQDLRAFAHHREEFARFADCLAEPGLELRAVSWPEVWSAWEETVPDIAAHLAELRARYGISLSLD